MKENYAMIKMTDKSGFTNGLPISIFIEELQKLPQDSILTIFRTQEDDGSFHKLLTFTYLTPPTHLI